MSNPLNYTVTPYVPEEKNLRGKCNIHRICEVGHLKALILSIQHNVYLNVKDNSLSAPLHRAIENNNCYVTVGLLESGAYPDIPNLSYKTPLHLAVENENTDQVLLLLKYGANPFLKDIHGRNCLDKSTAELKTILLNFNSPVVNIPTIYIKANIKAYANKISLDLMTQYSKIKFANWNTFIFGNQVTHYILDKDEEVTLSYIIAILKGIYIVTSDWIPFAVHGNWLMETMNYVPKQIAPVLYKSAETEYLNRPKLFDNIKFYVMEEESLHNVYNMKLLKRDLNMLLEIGGGTILNRPPMYSEIFKQAVYPYHTNIGNKSSFCSHIVIYNETYRPYEDWSDPKRLRYLPSKWIIESILKFSIDYPS